MMTDILLTNRDGHSVRARALAGRAGRLMALLEAAEAAPCPHFCRAAASAASGFSSHDRRLKIEPIAHPLHGTVRVPGSKKPHQPRACSSPPWPQGPTRSPTRYSLTTRATLPGRWTHWDLRCRPTNSPAPSRVNGGPGRAHPAERAELFIGNAGTPPASSRPLLTLGRGSYVLDGSARMRERPLADLLDALRQLGAPVESATRLPAGACDRRWPARRPGAGGRRCQQPVSQRPALVAPYAQAPVESVGERGLNSQPVCGPDGRHHGGFWCTRWPARATSATYPAGRYVAQDRYAIESDASAASSFLAAPAILGGTVRVETAAGAHAQGEWPVDVLAQMGCTVARRTTACRRRSALGRLRGVSVDMRHIPDTAQPWRRLLRSPIGQPMIRGIASGPPEGD